MGQSWLVNFSQRELHGHIRLIVSSTALLGEIVPNVCGSEGWANYFVEIGSNYSHHLWVVARRSVRNSSFLPLTWKKCLIRISFAFPSVQLTENIFLMGCSYTLIVSRIFIGTSPPFPSTPSEPYFYLIVPFFNVRSHRQ